MFGSLISSFIGVSVFKLFKEVIQKHDTLGYLAAAFSVSLSIVAMLLTRSLHPPAGATSLIAVLGSDKIHHLGYWYVFFPALLASTLHVVLGLLLNNLSSAPHRSYPTYWCPINLAFPASEDSSAPSNTGGSGGDRPADSNSTGEGNVGNVQKSEGQVSGFVVVEREDNSTL